MNKDCKGIFGFIFGHKFEGRYSKEETPNPIKYKGYPWNVIKAIKANTSKKSTYIYDICLRCGAIITRENEQNNK